MPDGGDTPQEVMTAFVKQYYNEATFIPKEVVLPYLPEEDESSLLKPGWQTRHSDGGGCCCRSAA